ncbi:MAG: trigger factor [Clostridia bacterium]|nr:trigger factor [Clostridia bacterium]
MSLKSVKNLETNVYELTVEISAEKFNDAVNKAYLKEKGKIAIPGFRKGKAPKSFIEKVYGEGVFFETALDSIYPEEVESAIAESKLDVVAAPYDAEVQNMSKEEGVTITLKVTVKPEVEVGEYKGIELTKKSTVVTDEEINREIDQYKERAATYEEVEGRPAADGDMAVIDFEGFVDGVAFEGGKAENHNLTLGSHSFIDTFEEQIVGHNVGDEFDVNVTFPEEYHAEELKGKPAVFKVKLNELKQKVYPELDDEFAMDVSEFDTFDAFKADLVKKIEDRKEKAAEADLENQIAEKLAEGLKAEIPEVMFEMKVDEFVRDMDMRLQGQGLNLEMYMQYTGMDIDALKTTFRVQAETAVKVKLALDKIAEVENIVVSQEAIDAEYATIADAYKVDVEVAKKAIDEKVIVDDLKGRATMDFVKAEAKITEEK